MFDDSKLTGIFQEWKNWEKVGKTWNRKSENVNAIPPRTTPVVESCSRLKTTCLFIKFAFQEIPLITVKCLYNLYTLRWYSKGKQYLKSMPLALYVHRRLISTWFDLIHTTTIWNWLGYAQMCLYFGCGLL